MVELEPGFLKEVLKYFGTKSISIFYKEMFEQQNVYEHLLVEGTIEVHKS